MTHWYMLALVGRDQAGIVARITQALFRGGANLGEASMLRLGGNFAMMMMVDYGGDAAAVQGLVQPEAQALGLTVHVDPIAGQLHRHMQSNMSVSVYGADRAGIVAGVTAVLADAGFHILNLESDVGGSDAKPLYIMHIEGYSAAAIEQVQEALAGFAADGIQLHVNPIQPMLG